MRSLSFPLLVAKEWRELIASRSFWLLLMMIGPLAGHGFIVAVGQYAEASGLNGNPAALPQALTPLDGLLVPTLGAYDLAATLLLPFVAIRLIAGEKENGGLKLLLQLPNPGKESHRRSSCFWRLVDSTDAGFPGDDSLEELRWPPPRCRNSEPLLGRLRMSISASVAVAAAIAERCQRGDRTLGSPWARGCSTLWLGPRWLVAAVGDVHADGGAAHV